MNNNTNKNNNTNIHKNNNTNIHKNNLNKNNEIKNNNTNKLYSMSIDNLATVNKLNKQLRDENIYKKLIFSYPF